VATRVTEAGAANTLPLAGDVSLTLEVVVEVTEKVTAADVAVTPTLSVAAAVTEWLPADTLFHV